MPREDIFGIALYSKLPIVQSDIRYIGDAEVPSIVAELETPEGRLTLIATHPVPPVGAEYSRLRNGQLERLAELVARTSPPVLALGDFNATPWCPHFQRLLARSGLRDSSPGRGILPTWPTYVPPLQIPLDHCLHKTGVGIVRKFRVPTWARTITRWWSISPSSWVRAPDHELCRVLPSKHRVSRWESSLPSFFRRR